MVLCVSSVCVMLCSGYSLREARRETCLPRPFSLCLCWNKRPSFRGLSVAWSKRLYKACNIEYIFVFVVKRKDEFAIRNGFDVGLVFCHPTFRADRGMLEEDSS